MIRNLMKVNSSLVSTLLRNCEQRAISCVCTNPDLHQPRTQVRWYASSIGQYDRLWQSVNSGKGIKVKRKTFPKGFPGWGFGSKETKIPGLNAPLDLTPESQAQKWDEEVDPGRNVQQSREIMWSQKKGWHGNSYHGRGIGPPITDEGVTMKGFDSCVIEVKRIRQMRNTGKTFTCSALVLVGNRKGALGWAIGHGKNNRAAMRKGRNKAMNYLHEIPICDDHTIYHDVKSKVNRTRIHMERKVDGHGLRCQRIVKAMADLAGIKDLRAKLSGVTTPMTVVQVTMQALLCQETHQELADRTGKYVLEHQPGVERPRVVAYPTPEAVALNRIETYDPMDILKPHLHQHAQKCIDTVKAKNPDIVKNTYENVSLS